ncbi:response regulator transcription factor [Oceanobacillus jeddahense]|uniref:response regulator transcription factor n=1 Tax=Oceanobacillus jeddahense TaxID=1462527 RepID=UPI000AD92EF5|nr:response regulator transcription factor [Oceanobacillus jeddahense]
MKSKIMLVDDEKDIVTFMKDSLEDEGYQVLVAYHGEEALRQLPEQPDLIVLDIMMPGMDGYQLCEEIRQHVSCPILFVSAKNTEHDRIKGLMVGGDDYIEKPFSLKELKTRIYAHLRREQRNAYKAYHRMHAKNLIIDTSAYEVFYQDKKIPFTYREFEIITFFVMHPNQVFTKEQIYEQVWGIDSFGDSTTIIEHIKKIRAKIQKYDPSTSYIITVWGVGYKWEG